MIPELKIDIPNDWGVRVKTTDYRGFTPEEVAELCVKRIVNVSDEAPPAIRDQARAFERQITNIVAFYMRQAIKSDRTTVYNALTDAGSPELAELIRRL